MKFDLNENVKSFLLSYLLVISLIFINAEFALADGGGTADPGGGNHLETSTKLYFDKLSEYLTKVNAEFKKAGSIQLNFTNELKDKNSVPLNLQIISTLKKFISEIRQSDQLLFAGMKDEEVFLFFVENFLEANNHCQPYFERDDLFCAKAKELFNLNEQVCLSMKSREALGTKDFYLVNQDVFSGLLFQDKKTFLAHEFIQNCMGLIQLEKRKLSTTFTLLIDLLNKSRFINSTSAFLNETTYELRSIYNTSFITVHEISENNFEIVYCQHDVVECIRLGNKNFYTLDELKQLKANEIIKTGATGLTAAVTILISGWAGGVGGGIFGLAVLSGAKAIKTAAFIGGASSAVFTGGEILNMDKFNPIKHYEVVQIVNKLTTDQTEYIKDVDQQALWLNTRLNLIP